VIFGIADTIFWDLNALDQELRRVSTICHGCRLCWNLCPSFPALFERIDAHDGSVAALTQQDFRDVVDLCYQCKLCFVKCPYVPPHEFALDFPKVMLRAKAVRVKNEGTSLQDWILGRPELLGMVGSATAPLSKWIPRLPFVRSLLHLGGVHRKRILPRYYRQTFRRWFGAHAPQGDGGNGKVAFFSTCFVNYNSPNVGIAAVKVLERNRVKVIHPPQKCCGMPLLDGGDIAGALKKANFNAASLAHVIKEGYEVVVPGPTCSYMLRHEYPHLVGGESAKLVAEHTHDLSEYLMKLHKRGKLDTQFTHRPVKISYHFPCHLKAQNIGYKSRDLMSLIPGAEVQVVEKCSGMDGTWGLKGKYFDLSLKVGTKLFNDIRDAKAETAVSDCPLAQIQIEQGTGMKALHPVEVIARAYGL